MVEELRGSFYHEEIRAVSVKVVYRLETLLQERGGVGGRT